MDTAKTTVGHKGKMMDQPVVSIVLTLYNGEEFIRETIDNIIAQTYVDWELIVVNDASSDKSSEIVHSFTDPRIRIIDLPENGHVSMAHRAGDQLAKGKYIAIQDKDDLWDSSKLEKQVSWMEAHTETGACFTLVNVIDQDGNPVEDPIINNLYAVSNCSRSEWLHELLTTGNHLANPSVMIRKSVLDDVGLYNPSFLQLHDYELWLRIVQKYDFYVIPEKLYTYRRFEGSGSISQINEVNIRRTLFEYTWCIGHTILMMEPEMFKTVFRNELMKKDAETDLEIRCEKALLLASDKLVTDCRVYAFELFEQLFRDPEAVRVLKDVYGFTQHNIYQMTGEPILYSKGDFEEIRRLNYEVKRWKQAADDIENSTSWRVTAPLRFFIDKLRKNQ